MSRSNYSLSFLLCLALSAPLQAEEAPPAAEGDTVEIPAESAPAAPLVTRPRSEPSPDLSRLQELVKSNSPETEIVWLESSEDRTVGLFHPQSQPEALGGIIIFPSEGTHADWPDYAHPLRLHLSDHGWQTLSVQLPTPPSLQPPTRTLPVLQRLSGNGGAAAPPDNAADGEDTPSSPAPEVSPPRIAEQTATDDTIDRPQRPYAERIQLLADSALQALTQRGAERIVAIGVGSGAVWASQFVKDQQENIASLGLVIINPSDPTTEVAPVLANLIPELKVPVVDIYQGQPSSSTLFEAAPKQRLRWAHRNQLNHYMQRRLSPRHADWEKQETWLSQQVDGLIRRHILAPLKKAETVEEEAAQQGPKTEQGPGRGTSNRPDPI